MLNKVPIFLVNLDDDEKRLDAFMCAVGSSETFEIVRIPAVYGKYLPDAACYRLSQDHGWVQRKGELGCFLSHVKAWELAAKLDREFCLILEDDVTPRGLDRITALALPQDCDVIFINDRMSPGSRNDAVDLAVSCLPISRALETLNRTKQGAGSDGYLITPAGARKLLRVTSRDLYYGNIDWRLVRYSVTPDLIDAEFGGTRVAEVIRHHHNRAMPPAWGILNSWCLNTPLVTFTNFGSRIVGP